MAIVEVTHRSGEKLSEVGHNRWHYDVPPVAFCRSGDTLIMDTRDALDGQVQPWTDAAQLSELDKKVLHPLTGPVFIEEARPGDLLEIELLEIKTGSFGYTAIQPGFGFLRDEFVDPFLAKWEIDEEVAVSADLPGVRIPAAPFLGIIGVAPDEGLLHRAIERESSAVASGAKLGAPFEPEGAIPAGPVAQSALRTLPPRENGGNLDIKQLGVGARLFLPVLVEGALLSVGDAHFSQGDGEVCGQAIETNARVRLRVTLHQGAAASRQVTGPQYKWTQGPANGKGRDYFTTTGYSFESRGAQLDAGEAARAALREMIQYLCGVRGLTREQAYILCSVSVDLKISVLADTFNVVVSANVPLDIFSESADELTRS